MALWTPADYAGTDKYAWVRAKNTGAATASSMTTSGSEVTQINDKWGSNHFNTTNVGRTGPDLGTLNGHTALSWTGNQGLSGPTIASAYTGPVTLIAVAFRDEPAGGNRGLIGALNNYFGLTTRIEMGGQVFSGGFNGSEYWNLQPDVRVGVIIFDNTTDAYVQGDGQTANTWTTNPHTIGGSGDCWELGRWAGGEEHLGTLGEAIIIHGKPSQDDIDRFVGYLVWDWYGDGTRLPIGHPYKSAAPTTGGGGTAYTLTAAAGSYAISGQATLRKLSMAANVGTYAITGQPTLRKLSMAAATGSYAITGQATLRKLSMAASTGSYALTGLPATLTYLPVGSTAYTLVADAGSYTITGQSTARKLTMSAATGAYALTGVATARKLSMGAGVGTYAISGQAASFVYTPAGPVAYTLTAERGTYSITGMAAALTLGAPQRPTGNFEGSERPDVVSITHMVLTYQWEADGIAIPGATSKYFDRSAYDSSVLITCNVTYRNRTDAVSVETEPV